MIRLITIILCLTLSPYALAEEDRSASSDTNEQATSQQANNQDTKTESVPPVAPIPPVAEKKVPANNTSGGTDDKAGSQNPPSEWASVYIAHQDMLEQASMADSTLWMAVWSAIAVFISFVTLIFLWRTVFYTKKAAISADATLEHARQALIESQKATAAAIEQAQQNRAFMVFDTQSLTSIREPGMVILKGRWTNYGKSPALKVEAHTDFWVTVSGLESPQTLPAMWRFPSGNSTVAPGAPKATTSRRIAAQEIPGNAHVLIHSECTYSDVHGRRFIHHFTGMCQVTDGVGEQPIYFKVEWGPQNGEKEITGQGQQ